MKTLLLLISLLDGWFALRALGHLTGFLRDGKFGHGTEVVAAVLLTAMAAIGVHVWWVGGDLRLGFAVAAGPWLLLFAVMLLALLTGKQQ